MNKKLAYEKPAVVHTEKIESRAISCGKANDQCTEGTAISS